VALAPILEGHGTTRTIDRLRAEPLTRKDS
jgi:hypothetical protein